MLRKEALDERLHDILVELGAALLAGFKVTKGVDARRRVQVIEWRRLLAYIVGEFGQPGGVRDAIADNHAMGWQLRLRHASNLLVGELDGLEGKARLHSLRVENIIRL